jgi:hypothetical protein
MKQEIKKPHIEDGPFFAYHKAFAYRINRSSQKKECKQYRVAAETQDSLETNILFLEYDCISNTRH